MGKPFYHRKSATSISRNLQTNAQSFVLGIFSLLLWPTRDPMWHQGNKNRTAFSLCQSRRDTWVGSLCLLILFRPGRIDLGVRWHDMPERKVSVGRWALILWPESVTLLTKGRCGRGMVWMGTWIGSRKGWGYWVLGRKGGWQDECPYQEMTREYPRISQE